MGEDVEISSGSNFYMILKAAMNVPGVQIKRSIFLRKELSKNFDNSIAELAISKNPASAGITTKQLERIAKSCINCEANKVTAISTLAGIPGGLGMIGTVPADTAQYFAHIIRILQKLIYLYGWQELYNTDGDFDDETTNQLTLFIGVMFGINTANTTISLLAKSAASKVERSLANKALTKGTIYPIIKKISTMLGVKMTKDIFAKSVGKVIPVIGGIVSGTVTYSTFKPLAYRLKKYLISLPTADVEFYRNEHYEKDVDINFDNIIDIE